jgi:hypothetical protein
VTAALAASSPWYCAALRLASQWLARLAQRLDAPEAGAETTAIRADETASAAPVPALESLRARDIAEERLREIRLRSLRYY